MYPAQQEMLHRKQQNVSISRFILVTTILGGVFAAATLNFIAIILAMSASIAWFILLEISKDELNDFLRSL